MMGVLCRVAKFILFDAMSRRSKLKSLLAQVIE
jgi:hypothetical protein